MTGSIRTENKTIRKFFNADELTLTLLNGGAGELVEGQEVKIIGNNSVDKRTVGTDYPIGYVKVGGASGAKIAVIVNISSDLQAIATGGTLAAGSFVKPNGTVDSDGRPQYVAAASGDYALGIVLSGGAATTEIRVGLLEAPVKI